MYYRYEIINPTTNEIMASRDTRNAARIFKTFWEAQNNGERARILRWTLTKTVPTFIR